MLTAVEPSSPSKRCQSGRNPRSSFPASSIEPKLSGPSELQRSTPSASASCVTLMGHKLFSSGCTASAAAAHRHAAPRAARADSRRKIMGVNLLVGENRYRINSRCS